MGDSSLAIIDPFLKGLMEKIRYHVLNRHMIQKLDIKLVDPLRFYQDL